MYKQMLKINKISENHAWGMLKHFALTLKAMYKSLERRHSFAPYKKGIHGEGRNLETVFSDPQVKQAVYQMQIDFGQKFNKVAKDQES